MAATNTVEIAPDGDVTLSCGEQVGDGNIVSLKVSSHILSYCSPVFRSLLSPRFKEGITLAATSSVEIPLPEDDPGHMTVLCNILHMRHDQSPSSVTNPITLAAFAALCDKYDCALSVKPTLEHYVTADLPTAQPSHLGKYLEVAVILRYNSLVQRIAQAMVLRLYEPAIQVVGSRSTTMIALCGKFAEHEAAASTTY
ncbi:hypothetical protein LTR17_008677 [Elasticomyces elasticus]|nr:hypothetical protein LTR17_008677 [Elasticomyces elasticus]